MMKVGEIWYNIQIPEVKARIESIDWIEFEYYKETNPKTGKEEIHKIYTNDYMITIFLLKSKTIMSHFPRRDFLVMFARCEDEIR